MKARIYYAETVEMLLTNLKDDYANLMKKRMDEHNIEKVNNCQSALIALGILEDRLFELEDEMIEM